MRSVRLIGSWDNFSTSYPMERDSRRDRGQWKGCYAFSNITCDDDSGVGPARDGGLKMGNTYHYYVSPPPPNTQYKRIWCTLGERKGSNGKNQYELDGTHETHDPSRPTTRHCPYMPGQTVNTLSVPTQRSLRKRSASLTSIRASDFMTMNPRDKYTTPRPAPRAPAIPHLPASSHILRHRASSRSLSPSPSWRRFFRRSPEPPRTATPEVVEPSVPEDSNLDARSFRSFGSGSRSRDISPESLSRFLRDETPAVEEGAGPAVMVIPEEEDEADADADDDDNFASEMPWPAGGLAPPPFRRAVSAPSPLSEEARGMAGAESPALPDFERRSRFSFSSVSSAASSVGSPGGAPVVYGLEEQETAYELPGSRSSKVGGVVGVEEDLSWMVDVIKS